MESAFDNPTPIEALFSSEGMNPNPDIDANGLMSEADVIFGVDVMTCNRFLVYGRDALKRIARIGLSEDLAVVVIELDQESEELEKLIALVEVLKGKHDYRSRED